MQGSRTHAHGYIYIYIRMRTVTYACVYMHTTNSRTHTRLPAQHSTKSQPRACLHIQRDLKTQRTHSHMPPPPPPPTSRQMNRRTDYKVTMTHNHVPACTHIHQNTAYSLTHIKTQRTHTHSLSRNLYSDTLSLTHTHALKCCSKNNKSHPSHPSFKVT